MEGTINKPKAVLQSPSQLASAQHEASRLVVKGETAAELVEITVSIQMLSP